MNTLNVKADIEIPGLGKISELRDNSKSAWCKFKQSEFADTLKTGACVGVGVGVGLVCADLVVRAYLKVAG
jgi:hypothetical protein